MAERTILVLTQYYEPEPGFITAAVAQSLAREGRVVVVTAHPNHPIGRFPRGTRWWRPVRTVEAGVIVYRLPVWPDRSRSLFRRGLSYFSFLLMASLFAPFVAGRPRLVWVYQTPFTTAIAAIWFKLAYRAQLVYTIADLWPESFEAAGVIRPGLITKAARMYRRWSNAWADAIICSTRGTVTVLQREGVSAGRLHYVPVWSEGADAIRLADTPPEPVVVYAGNIGPAQALEAVIEAAAILEREGVPVQFRLYGTGSSAESLQASARRLGVRTVHFMGQVPPEEAFRASSRALAQIVSLRRSPQFEMTVPSKLSFSLAAGAPLIYGLAGEAAEIARESGGGIPYDQEDPSSLAEAVKQSLSLAPEVRAARQASMRSYYLTHFAPARLLDQYRQILGAHARL